MRNDDKLWREWEADVDRVLRSQIEGLYREADEAEDTSSPEFLERMNELLGMEEQERPKRTHRRKHAKVAKVAGVAALFANADWSFGKLFEKVYDEFTLSASDETVLTKVGPDVNNQIAKQFPDVYVLTVLPEGYELVSKEGDTFRRILLVYSDGDGTITFEQRQANDIVGQDNENSSADTISVNGVTYQIVNGQDGNRSSGLIWKVADMEFTILGPFAQEDLITMAESVERAGK